MHPLAEANPQFPLDFCELPAPYSSIEMITRRDSKSTTPLYFVCKRCSNRSLLSSLAALRQ
jgi:hypothetical protein